VFIIQYQYKEWWCLYYNVVNTGLVNTAIEIVDLEIVRLRACSLNGSFDGSNQLWVVQERGVELGEQHPTVY